MSDRRNLIIWKRECSSIIKEMFIIIKERPNEASKIPNIKNNIL